MITITIVSDQFILSSVTQYCSVSRIPAQKPFLLIPRLSCQNNNHEAVPIRNSLTIALSLSSLTKTDISALTDPMISTFMKHNQNGKYLYAYFHGSIGNSESCRKKVTKYPRITPDTGGQLTVVAETMRERSDFLPAAWSSRAMVDAPGIRQGPQTKDRVPAVNAIREVGGCV
ncbi:hypothetical protein J6590_031365 [Homalodisca vitripennis]|nr:hypothetical protein J6590_031365 [Homalodisca vitripennis]